MKPAYHFCNECIITRHRLLVVQVYISCMESSQRPLETHEGHGPHCSSLFSTDMHEDSCPEVAKCCAVASTACVCVRADQAPCCSPGATQCTACVGAANIHAASFPPVYCGRCGLLPPARGPDGGFLPIGNMFASHIPIHEQQVTWAKRRWCLTFICKPLEACRAVVLRPLTSNRSSCVHASNPY